MSTLELGSQGGDQCIPESSNRPLLGKDRGPGPAIQCWWQRSWGRRRFVSWCVSGFSVSMKKHPRETLKMKVWLFNYHTCRGFPSHSLRACVEMGQRGREGAVDQYPAYLLAAREAERQRGGVWMQDVPLKVCPSDPLFRPGFPSGSVC